MAITKISAEVLDGKPRSVGTELLGFTSIPWAADDRTEIMKLIHAPDTVTLKQVGRAQRIIADRTAAAVLTAISEAGLTKADVNLIASHGKCYIRIIVARCC